MDVIIFWVIFIDFWVRGTHMGKLYGGFFVRITEGCSRIVSYEQRWDKYQYSYTRDPYITLI